MLCDIGTWVEQAGESVTREFRAAVHTILHAIANSQDLQSKMLIKGGILLALRYNSLRHTRDIDFSTDIAYSDFDLEIFKLKLESSLIAAVESLDYDVDCRIQSVKPNPKREDATFPTVVVSVGYASKGSKKHRRLISKNSTDTVRIEYSFNEFTNDVEQVQLVGGGELLAYSLPDLIAEKFRAILQQKVRNRFRRQDAYDLFMLLQRFSVEANENKNKILSSLLKKSTSRDLQVVRESMRNPEIVRRSREHYHQIKAEIQGELPAFQEVYSLVQNFYESLPWE